MKKLLALLFIIALCFALWSCGKCTEHVDENGDLKCDNCEADVPCTNHVDSTTNGSYKCDKCGAVMTCTDHADDDENLSCDECGKRLECTSHIDSDGDNECDKCFEFVPCKNHTDEDANLECDKCSEEIDCEGHTDANKDNACDICKSKLACSEHVDANGDLKCDKCSAAVACTAHKDDNRDLKCDKCTADVECTHIDENNDGVCDVEKCKWDYDHEHTYNTAWSSDENKHWHAPSCKHTVANADEAAHSDEDNNGVCDVCQYVMCSHSEVDEESEEWKSDASGHWRPLKCEHDAKPDASKITAHSFNSEGLCECGYEQAHVHTFVDTWSTTETEHYRKSNCEHETEETGRGAHVDEDEYDGKCDVCDYVMCDCAYDEAWYHDNDNHWHQAKLGCDHLPKKDMGAHADGDNNGLCDGCSWNYDHKHPFRWISDENGHKKEFTCTHDIEDLEEGEHADADNDRLCDVCGYDYGHEHIFSTEWLKDETHHWHICTDADCAQQYTGAKDSYGAHTDNDGDFTCDVCGADYEEKAPELPDDEDDVIETPKFEVTPATPQN